MKTFIGICLGLLLGIWIGGISVARHIAPEIVKTDKKNIETQSKLLLELDRLSEVDSLHHAYDKTLDSLKSHWMLTGVEFDN